MEEEKILIILQGIPGAGKSFTAQQLAPLPNIFETDNYWINDAGEYKFNPAKLRHAHEWNQRCVEAAMMECSSPIVVANTNLTPKDRQPYIALALKYKYSYSIKFPTSPWFQEIHPRLRDKTFTDDDVKLFFEKNTHGVPFESIRNMMSKWQE